MVTFEDEPSGPLIVMSGEQFSENCHDEAAGCDPVLGMASAKLAGIGGAPLADVNTGMLICRGLRRRTPEENAHAQLCGHPAAEMICNLEIAFTPGRATPSQ